jgi:membrane-associated phospholipid phosphatase
MDRALGRQVRDGAARVGVAEPLRFAGRALAPAFRGMLVVLVWRRRTRSTAIEAILASLLAAGVARMLRDAIGRPRPGPREDGGFPSRHAAAAAAIAASTAGRSVGVPIIGAAAVTGLFGRVVSGEHDPADIGAGVALGVAASAICRTVARVVGARRTVRRW